MHILNWSQTALDGGVILHTEVTIGYDVSWRKVHTLLIEATRGVEGLLVEPPPFVLQTALNDHHVSYELNAYTATPTRMQQIYTQLHQNIQDRFNEAGIEIMSPLYGALRDGNATAIPQEYLPGDHEPGEFRFRSR
jgi:small-conductance mechanosensitive channel